MVVINKKPKVVAFLDIDGVLNSHRFWLVSGEDSWSEVLDKASCKAFMDIVTATDAQIVISSAWRFITGREDTIRILGQNGIDTIRIIDVTGDEDERDPRRSKEIQQWLDKNPDVDAWIAVDDSCTILDLKHHIHTTMLDGLQEQHVKPAIEIIEAQLKERHEAYLKAIEKHMQFDDEYVNPEFSAMVDWVEAYEKDRWMK